MPTDNRIQIDQSIAERYGEHNWLLLRDVNIIEVKEVTIVR